MSGNAPAFCCSAAASSLVIVAIFWSLYTYGQVGQLVAPRACGPSCLRLSLLVRRALRAARRRPCRKGTMRLYAARCSGSASPAIIASFALNLAQRAADEGWGPRLQRLLIPVDRVSTFVGQLFAWTIVLLTFAVSYEVFSRYVLGRADRLGLRCELHPLWRAVHHGGRLCAVAQRPCARRFPLSRLAATPPGRRWTSCSISCSSSPASSPSSIQAMVLRRSRGSHARAFGLQPGRPAGLSLQDADPGDRRAAAAAGHRRGGPLHRLPADRRSGRTAARRRGTGEGHPRAEARRRRRPP